MNFLNPLFWLGALGIAAPVWLHLRRRTRKNVQSFSALRFLDDQPSPRDMPLQIRDLPLLLLRALALLLLVVAFAWPFLKNEAAGQSEVRIYLLDNTLSHRVDGAFERARAEIAREIRKAPPGTQIGVVEIAARSRTIADPGTPREDAAAAVEALQPSHQRGNYLDGFRLAAAMLDRSLGQKRKILVYGDRQKNQWEENVNVPPFLRDVEVVLAEAPGRNGQGNLYVANARVLRLPQRDGSTVSLTLDLGSQAANRAANVAIFSDGKEVMNRELAIDGGKFTVQTGWPADALGWLRGEVAIDGKPDVLPGDNRGYFAVPPLVPGRVGLLSRSLFLRTTLDPEITKGFWDVTVLDPAGVREEAAKDKPTFDAVVADSDFLQSKDARDIVLRHLNNGRGVLLFISRKTPLIEGFLRSVGFQMGAEHVLSDDQQAFRYVALAHPILEPFTQPDFGDLLAVRIKRYFELSAEKADGLLFAGNGDPVLFGSRDTKGRMLVFGFGAEAESSNWPLRPDFLPFIDLCLRFVRALPDQQVSVEPGETYFRQIEGGAGVTYDLIREGKTFSSAKADEKGRLHLVVPDEPGIYELSRKNETGAVELVSLLSVSPSAKESQLEYIEQTPPVLETWTLAPVDQPEAKAESSLPIAQMEENQKLWWWVLLAGAVFLLGEMAALAARRRLA